MWGTLTVEMSCIQAGHRKLQTHCAVHFLNPSKVLTLKQQSEGLLCMPQTPICAHQWTAGSPNTVWSSASPHNHTSSTSYSLWTHSKCTFRSLESHFSSSLWHMIMLAISTVSKLLPSLFDVCYFYTDCFAERGILISHYSSGTM